MEAEIQLKPWVVRDSIHGKSGNIAKKSVYILYCTTKKCQFWHFLVVMAWRQGRKQTVSPIDIQWRSIKKSWAQDFFLKKVTFAANI